MVSLQRHFMRYQTDIVTHFFVLCKICKRKYHTSLPMTQNISVFTNIFTCNDAWVNKLQSYWRIESDTFIILSKNILVSTAMEHAYKSADYNLKISTQKVNFYQVILTCACPRKWNQLELLHDLRSCLGKIILWMKTTS